MGRTHAVPLALAFTAALGLSAVMTDVVTGVAVVWSMLLAVMAVRRLSSAIGWRILISGGLLLGFGPVLSDFDLGGWSPWSWGDLVAGFGYVLFVIGLERVLRSRTIAVEWPVVVDSALIAGWLVVLSFAAFGQQILDRMTTLEAIAAFSYLPLTFALIFQVLRLLLGSSSTSPAVSLLAVGVGAGAASELLFLAVASGVTSARPVAIGVATAGLVFLSSAVSHSSASELEDPVSGDFGELGPLGVLAIVTSIVAVVLLGISPLANTVPVMAGLVVISVLMSIRVLLLLLERDGWVNHERAERELVSKIMEAGEPDEIYLRAEDAIEFLLRGSKLLEIGFWKTTGAGWVLATDEGHSESIESAALDEGCSNLTVVRSEFVGGPTGDYMTELVVPVDTNLGLLVESLPVLDSRQVSRIRSIVDSVSVSLRALDFREQSHQERADSRFRALVQDSNDIIMVVNAELGTVEYVGPTLGRILGHSERDYVGADPLQHMHDGDQSTVRAELELSNGTLEPFDVRVQANDGDYHWFALSVRDLADESELAGLLYSFADINDRKMAELQLLTSEGRYRSLVKNAKDVFALIDGDSRITFVSPNVEALLGYLPNDLIGTDVRGLLSDRGTASLQDLLRRNDRGLIGMTVEVELKTASDEERTVEVVFSDPGLVDEAETLVTVRDITEQKRLEESLRHQTLYDPLTGLYNRASIYPELARGLQAMSSTETIAVLHINVVGFRQINESVGFGEADDLLVEIGSRLRAVLRPEDSIARFNADEFAVITTAPTVGQIFDLASRLLATFEEPFVVGDRSIDVRALLGLDTSSDRRQNATTLLENAALAMRAAQERDEPITVFEEPMRIQATERFELVADFRTAIDEEQFSLVFQPLFDLEQNKVSSVEALLRWNHPNRGLVSPAVFIPLAEESGFIIDLGQWVLRKACEQLVEWHENLPNGRGLSMSVNVSARQLESAGSGQSLLEIIEASGVEKSSLTVELTETVLIADAEWLRDELELFRGLGIKIAVDDFGAGAAGLNHLRDVPFDVLKIDKSYIDNLEHSEESYNLVAGVIELAHGMKTRLVAEGIETPKQASLLRQMGCDYGQGFYLGRPMAANRLEEWFAMGRDGSVAAVISDVR